MDFFYKHKSIIIRGFGVLMLLIGFVSYFWVSPKEGATENELAAANVARLEAQVKGVSAPQAAVKPSASKFVEKFQETRDAQIRYLTILLMLSGAGFLLYSFFKKEE